MNNNLKKETTEFVPYEADERLKIGMMRMLRYEKWFL